MGRKIGIRGDSLRNGTERNETRRKGEHAPRYLSMPHARRCPCLRSPYSPLVIYTFARSFLSALSNDCSATELVNERATLTAVEGDGKGRNDDGETMQRRRRDRGETASKDGRVNLHGR